MGAPAVITLKIITMNDKNFRFGDAKTDVFGSDAMLQPAPVDKIPDGPTTPQIAYQMVKDETFAQTQPRLNLATFVTTYMDEYATRLMNEAININYIDETEYPRIAVMNGKLMFVVVAEDSSFFAFSAASFSLCRAILSLDRSTPSFALKSASM